MTQRALEEVYLLTPQRAPHWGLRATDRLHFLMKDVLASFSQFISNACCSVLDCTLEKEGFWGHVCLFQEGGRDCIPSSTLSRSVLISGISQAKGH